MSSAVRAFAHTILPVLVLAAGAGEALAQACFDPSSSRQAVYFTGPDNDISCVLDFTLGTSRQVANSGGSLFRGLYVLYEGPGAGLSIVAASTTQGGDIQVFGCDTNGEACVQRGVAAAFPQVTGVALDTYGNIAAVNGTKVLYVPRCTAGDPACPATGYGVPRGPFAVPGASQVVDVRFVSNAVETGSPYGPGDVLVLASSPAEVRIYSGSDLAHPTSPALVYRGSVPVPAGLQPTGLAVFPKTGELLVTTNEGAVTVYSRATGQWTGFVGSVAGQAVNAAIGNTNPTSGDPANGSEVFVTATNNGRVLRYVATRNGGGALVAAGAPQSLATGNPPYGVGNATLTDAAWTPTGSGVTVLPAVGQELTFEKTTTPGFSESRVYLIESSRVLDAGGAITGEMVGLPADQYGFPRPVPAHVECIDRAGGGCYYLVYVTETTAGFFGSTQKHVIHDEELGLTASCGDPDPTREPRLFYAPDDLHSEIVEGGTLTSPASRQGFIDITTGCGSHIGRGAQFSLFLTGRDMRPLAEIAGAKLAALDLALRAADASQGGLNLFVPKKVRKTLTNASAKAASAYARGNFAATQSYLASIVTTTQTYAAAFAPTVSGVTRNAAGEIVARAESARYMVCRAAPGATGCAVDTHD